MNNKVLVTGGAGYIGSHTVKQLKENGYEVLILDNLSFGNKKLVDEKELVVGDIADEELVSKIIDDFKPDSVIHFAALKDAAESVIFPEKYFYHNLSKTIKLLNVLVQKQVKNFIFSSTAAVYGDVHDFPITEDFPVSPINPYGESKAMIEDVLLEYKKVGRLNPVILRYFNAGGADSNGQLGNLYPNAVDVISVIVRVAKEGANFTINGTDYNTKDGSPIRDIIHVEDLASAHVKALDKLIENGNTGIYNLGSQNGYSIKEIVESAQEITGKDIKVVSGPRRNGDIVVSIASSEKAKDDLGWKAELGIKDIIRSAWNWENIKEKYEG